MRAGKHAVRVMDRLDTGSEQGHWVFDLDTAGDMPQWLCWPNKKGGDGRQIPGWAQVWPAMVQAGSGGGRDVPTPGGGGGSRPPVPTQGGSSPGSRPDIPTGDSSGEPSLVFYQQNASGGFDAVPGPVVGGSPSFNIGGNNAGGNNIGPLILGINGSQIYVNGQPASNSGFAGFSIGGNGSLSSLSGIQGVGTGGGFAQFTYGGSSSLSALSGIQGVGSGSSFARFTFGGSSSLESLTGIPGVGFGGGFARFIDPSAPGNGVPPGGVNIGAGQDAMRGGGVQNLLGGGGDAGDQGDLGDPGLPGEPGASTPHACGSFNGKHQVLPLHGYEMLPDQRYAALAPILPSGAGMPKFVAGMYGLVVSATNEETQIEYLFPSWTGQLISVNQAGDPKMGTLVCDLTGSFTVDPSRTSPLQSMIRVAKKPLGGANALAWNIDQSGCHDVRGGFVGERPEGGAGDDYAFGLASYSDGGPFCVGSKRDKHRIGVDADGHVINALHIKTSALFRMEDARDGPIRFEKTYKDGNEFPIPVKGHLAWTGKDWAIWTSALFLQPVDLLKPQKPGKGYPNAPYPPSLPTNPSVPTQGAGSGRPGDVPTVDPRFTTGAPVATGSRGMQFLNLVASIGPVQAPAMVSQAQNYSAGQANTGMFDGATAGNMAKGMATNPSTGVMSGFGAQGGATGGGGSSPPTPQGGEGDPWVYTTPPFDQAFKGTQSKMPGGTANGGWIIHPPETDLRDARDFGMVPPNQSLSTTYFMTSPGAWFGAGTPELATGAPRSGYSWGMDSSTGDLLFRSHSFSEPADNAVRFTNTAQTIQWYATKSFYGELSHANTADRTYTFPDSTGTVLVHTLVANAAGAAVTVGNTGGSGPESSTIAKWLRMIGDDGGTYFVEGYQ